MGKNNRAPTNSAIPNIRGFKQEHQSRDIKIDSENYAKTHRQTSAASASINNEEILSRLRSSAYNYKADPINRARGLKDEN